MNASVEETRFLAVEVVLACTLLPIMVMAVIGNIMVIVAVTQSWKLRNHVSNVFIVNLAITDLGCAVLVMPFSLVSVWYNELVFSLFWCKSVCFFNYLFIITSMLTLALISVDRYIFVVYPLRYDIIVTFRRAIGLIIGAWVVGFIFAVIPSATGWVWYDNSEIICTIDWETMPTEPVQVYTICAFVVCFGIPVLVMMCCYWGIYKVAKRHAARITPTLLGLIDSSSSDTPSRILKVINNRHVSPRQLNSIKKHQPSRHSLTPSTISTSPESSSSADRRFSSQSSSGRPSYSKAIKPILIIISIYLITNLPFSLTKLIKVISEDNSAVPFYVNTVASLMAFVNPSCNPVVYSILRDDFKTAFRKILPIPTMCRRLCGRRNQPQAPPNPSLVASGRARAISGTNEPTI
ncbi:beta-1 adrenergic receptor-like [Asterias rubens]|uniref:beta-1 adrenergic receptor-like n=1 Tax=Asterias rubens TaxID=7604 RepID=UPI00145580A2|nr:beta-1 adrenergic receptor-like [Asterias rubens]